MAFLRKKVRLMALFVCKRSSANIRTRYIPPVVNNGLGYVQMVPKNKL